MVVGSFGARFDGRSGHHQRLLWLRLRCSPQFTCRRVLRYGVLASTFALQGGLLPGGAGRALHNFCLCHGNGALRVQVVLSIHLVSHLDLLYDHVYRFVIGLLRLQLIGISGGRPLRHRDLERGPFRRLPGDGGYRCQGRLLREFQLEWGQAAQVESCRISYRTPSQVGQASEWGRLLCQPINLCGAGGFVDAGKASQDVW